MSIDNDNYSSNFGAATSNSDSQFDFTQADCIEHSGSTCDAYVMRYHGRRVFVKRLKAQYAGDPRLVAAFEKEFELGVKLKHKSLPTYYELRDSAIVMDYISGNTIESMIKSGDRWLTFEKNIRRMLSELVDVIDYMHQNHIVHCDIKTDNVMLSNGSPRVLMLIDLGCCYTDYLDNSAGRPENYDKEKVGDPGMDYVGIGKLVRRLSKRVPDFPSSAFMRFEEECFREGVEPDDLRDVLIPQKPKKNNIFRILLAIVALIIIAVSTIVLMPWSNESSDKPETTDISPVDSVAIPEIQDTIAKNAPSAPAIEKEIENNEKTPPSSNTTAEVQPIKLSNEELQPTLMDVINAELPAVFAPLLPRLEALEALANCDTTSVAVLLDAIRDFAEIETVTQSEGERRFQNRYPEFDRLEVSRLVWHSKAWDDYMTVSNRVQRYVGDEIRRRAKAAKSADNFDD